MRATIPLLLVSGALCAACATAPKPEEPRRPFLPYQLAPQQPVARSGTALRKSETLGERKKEFVPAVRIDNEIMVFALQQRQSRFTSEKGIAMPPAVRSNWSEVLGHIDRLLRVSADKILPLDAVRARVALEAELEMDREHYLAMPDGLAAGIQARARTLDQRLAEIRALQKQNKPVKRFFWPLDPVVVTSLFGMRADPFNGEDREHQGVDLKAEVGQLVQACAQGTVVMARKYAGHGLHVEIEHPGGMKSSYSHLSTLLVTEGMQVPARGPIGLAGNTGRSTGPHLHLEIWMEGSPVDPLGVLPDPAYEDLYSAAP
ncbi:MAG TPA: M23 family metallopeptidase [Myxococcales bacterium]